jgi:hypothetical protein
MTMNRTINGCLFSHIMLTDVVGERGLLEQKRRGVSLKRKDSCITTSGGTTPVFNVCY